MASPVRRPGRRPQLGAAGIVLSQRRDPRACRAFRSRANPAAAFHQRGQQTCEGGRACTAVGLFGVHAPRVKTASCDQPFFESLALFSAGVGFGINLVGG